MLGAVKTEFAKFGDVLDKVKRQLDTASRTIEETGRRTRAMERKLRSVEQLSDEESVAVLGAADLLQPMEPEDNDEPDGDGDREADGEQDEAALSAAATDEGSPRAPDLS